MPHSANKRMPMGQRALSALMVAAALSCSGPLLAEKADRNKPVNIESDRMTADDAKKTATFEGRVILTQGTMVIRAHRVTVRQDKEGFQSGTALGTAGGGLATFRQKREGANEFIDAQAERIEYDSKTDRVEFFNNARLSRSGGDDVCGHYISYDSRTEFFTVNSNRNAGQAGSRVHAVLMPRNPDAQAETKPSAKPATPCPN